ncbi:MAG: hypothetical protein IT443_12975 [Phycisphaeraceae bacterium]|nr:hypothetical protein [Phycisphaeraceae bacterium]
MFSGWFFKSKKGAKKSKSARSVGPKWDPAKTLKTLQAIGVGCLAVLLVVGWWGGEKLLLEYQHERQVGRAPTLDDVRLANPPGWMSPQVEAELRVCVAEQLSADPLDRASLVRSLYALAANPWVEKANKLERWGQKVWVTAEYRQPVALVEQDGHYLLVDGMGVRLPGDYGQEQLSMVGLPVLWGVAEPSPQEGMPWPGEDLHAGLDLLAFLRNESFLEQVRGIAVRDEQGQVRPMLLTSSQDGRVFWGKPPGVESPVEVPAEVKRQRLAAVYHQRGSIDLGGKRVHVYGPAIFVERAEPVGDEIIDLPSGKKPFSKTPTSTASRTR